MSALEALRVLVRSCKEAALSIEPVDAEARDELLDALAIAEISVLRLMAEAGALPEQLLADT